MKAVRRGTVAECLAEVGRGRDNPLVDACAQCSGPEAQPKVLEPSLWLYLHPQIIYRYAFSGILRKKRLQER